MCLNNDKLCLLYSNGECYDCAAFSCIFICGDALTTKPLLTIPLKSDLMRGEHLFKAFSESKNSNTAVCSALSTGNSFVVAFYYSS